MGLHRDPPPEPTLWLSEGVDVHLGQYNLQVFHCPGHTPGHVFFYSKEAKSAFVGDIIFKLGIGRTDLPGGSERILLKNISEKVLTLPDETTLLPGHGPATSVAEERNGNPFLG
jgi:glyoxylase-like metal-dependent hydrolase (beta-lactamase superfamily II)